MVLKLHAKMNKKLLLIVALGIPLLSACTHLNHSTAPKNDVISQAERSTQLQAIQQWQLEGAISVTEQKQHIQANVLWQQRRLNQYTLHLFGPLGLGSTTLNNTTSGVELINAKGETLYANTPEELIKQQLNITLPVSDLQYWIRGLPAPNSTFSSKYDQYNHLSTLQQEGWTISYTSYMYGIGTDLPHQIQLTHGDIKVKIAIASWT